MAIVDRERLRESRIFIYRSAGAARSGGRLVLPPSASSSNDSSKMNRGGSGSGASRSVESFIEAVPPVTNGSLLGGGGNGDELSIGCGILRLCFT